MRHLHNDGTEVYMGDLDPLPAEACPECAAPLEKVGPLHPDHGYCARCLWREQWRRLMAELDQSTAASAEWDRVSEKLDEHEKAFPRCQPQRDHIEQLVTERGRAA